jgi:hypothetical protein
MSIESVTSTREQVAARKEREYFDWLKYQMAQETEEFVYGPEFEPSAEAPYRLACEALGIDHDEIKRRAGELIENHDFKPKTEWVGEYEDNARTVLFEILAESGHLSLVEFRDTPEEMNRKTLERWLNGVNPDLPDHEQKRRFNEVCEELIIQEVQARILAQELPPDTQIATESTYITGMSDKEATRLGYRYQNKKGMLRSTGFILHDDGTVTRRVEQVSYSNSSAHDSIQRRHEEGISIPRYDEADVDLLGAPLLFSLTDMQEGVIGIQRRIDAFAGEGARFGVTPTETTPTYESLREVSAQRESHVESFVQQLADWERELDKQLAAGEITQPQHDALYMKEVRSIIRAICVLQPEYTKDALGEKVVNAYQEANRKMMAGDSDGAADIIGDVSNMEADIAACGLFESVSQGGPVGDTDQVLRNKLRNAKENWVWKNGTCRVDSCPTRPRRVKVGPCAVCVSCQDHFDRGRSPWEVYADAHKRERELQMLVASEQVKAASEREIKYRFEEQVGIGHATVYAYHNDTLVAEGDEALRLKQVQMS